MQTLLGFMYFTLMVLHAEFDWDESQDLDGASLHIRDPGVVLVKVVDN